MPNAIYHVMLRGNDGQLIFLSDADRCHMCLLMQEGIEKFGHRIHSFCLMSNHIHLAIQVGETSISRIMQHLAFRYAAYFNKKHERIGHLFQGRFKSIIVDGSCYLEELVRYIHLNPVRACITDRPENYIWSSHRAYLMLEENTWLTRDRVLRFFGSTKEDAIKSYEKFILKGIDATTIPDFKSGSCNGFLGGEEYVVTFLASLEVIPKPEIPMPKLISKLCAKYNLSPAALSGKQREHTHFRAVLAYLVRDMKHLTFEELAICIGHNPNTLSKLAHRFQKKISQSPTLAVEIDDVRNWLQMS